MNSNWFVCWNFGRKSGEPMRPRPEPPKKPSMVMPGEAARDDRVVDRRPGWSPRAAAAGRRAAAPRPTSAFDHEKRNSFTTVGREMRVQPATRAVGLDPLVAEGRGAGAVDDAAEGAGDVARCGSSRCSARTPLSLSLSAQVEARQGSGRSCRSMSALARRSCWRPTGSAAAPGRGCRRANGSMRSGGMVLPGNGWPVSGSRMAVEKMPGAVARGGHAGDAGDAAGDARAFVVGEEERLVLDDRAAEVGAELVLVVRRASAGSARFEKKSFESKPSLR